MDGRICTACGEFKPWAEFSSAAHGLNGHNSECRGCHAARRPEPQAQALTCRQCGAEFPNQVRRGPDRKYCSPVCKTAWWREQRGKERQSAPLRPCNKCGAPVPHKTGLAVCKECRVDDRSSTYRRAVHIKSLYGITEAEYDRLLAQQRHRCAICKAETPGSRGEWRVDHDHATGQVRGLLCNNCNSGIGYLKDDPDVLAAAARYVAKHRQAEPIQRKAG